MSDRDYPMGVRAALWSLSRGACYKPACGEAVVVIEGGIPILRLEIAHIHGLNSGSARYDENVADPDAFENLILLCNAHHKLIDKLEPNSFPADLLKQWKVEREAPGVAALAGLKNVTEDRLQKMLTESYEAIQQQLEDSLARFAQFDSEAAELLSVVNDEIFNPTRLNVDAVEMLSLAAHDLRLLPDSAETLLTAAGKLERLGDVAETLAQAADHIDSLIGTVEELSGLMSSASQLHETATTLSSAATTLADLPDTVSALHSAVNDMRRYRPDY